MTKKIWLLKIDARAFSNDAVFMKLENYYMHDERGGQAEMDAYFYGRGYFNMCPSKWSNVLLAECSATIMPEIY
ncbi:hypothetical protein I7856_13420 [Pseudomonas tolaasii]|nr:hypothetical protein [Pseudomonas tolaasii]